MAIKFPKKQEQRLIPKYLLEYSEELAKNHPDPSADWGGGGGSPIEAGEGIVITGDETKTISVDDETVAMVANLSTVAFSGSYSDLSNKPDLSVYELKSEAFSGDYDDLTNKPDLSVYELKSDAFSGNYNDLTNKPAIPTKTSELTNDSNFIPSALGNTRAYSIYETTPLGSTWSRATYNTNSILYETQDNNSVLYFPTNKSGIIAVTGDIITSYNDLTDKPTIPTVGNGTITIKKNNTTVDTFTTNQSTNKSINITVPTDTSDLTNGAGFITSAALTSYITTTQLEDALDDYALSTDIPENVSDLTNDAGYTTQTWVQNQGYITGITSSDVITALGYTPGTSNFTGLEVIAMSESDYTISASDYAKLGVNTIITRSETNTSNVWTYTYLGDNDTYIKYGRTIPQYASGTSDGEFRFQILLIKKVARPNKTHAISIGYNVYHVQLPTIPTVNDNTITITQGGVTKGSFTLNQNTNQTINIDDAPGMIGEVLYDVPNGEAGVNPITMAHSFADYSYVDIQYRCYDNAYEVKSVRVYDPNGKHVYLDWDVLVSGTVYAKKSIYILNGTTMTVKDGTDMQAWYSNGSTMGTQATATTDYQHQIKITKVVGYKQNSAPIVIPTTATSVSTVTPSTTQLVFTYTDNTTETVTLMTGASVSTTTTIS